MWWAASDLGWVVGHSYICYGPLLHGNTTVLYEVWSILKSSLWKGRISSHWWSCLCLPYIFKLYIYIYIVYIYIIYCIYIFSVCTLPSIAVIRKENLLHYGSNLSTSSAWLVLVSGTRNSKTAELEMANGEMYLCCWGFSHKSLDYLYYGFRRGCCVLHVWRWQILTESELEAIGNSMVGARTLKETCLFFPPPATQGIWSQDSDDIGPSPWGMKLGWVEMGLVQLGWLAAS